MKPRTVRLALAISMGAAGIVLAVLGLYLLFGPLALIFSGVCLVVAASIGIDVGGGPPQQPPP